MTAELVIDGENLDVTFKGIGGVLAFKSQIVVPLSSVESVEAVEIQTVERPTIKRVGARIPGLLATGSFGTGDDIQFWYIHKADRVLVVDLTGDKYKRLVLEVPDPDAVAKEIHDAIPSKP
ncbi:MAG: hypothetical protein HQ526_06605 [Actinobacteria bacterium]|nr:hypothetical protein [Actinomycetota bacterium]